MKEYIVRKFPIDQNSDNGSLMEDVGKQISVTIWNDESPVKFEVVSTTTAAIKDQLYLIVTFGRQKTK